MDPTQEIMYHNSSIKYKNKITNYPKRDRGIDGNEIADNLACQAANSIQSYPYTKLPYPGPQSSHSLITTSKRNGKLNGLITYLQKPKRFFPKIDSALVLETLTIPHSLVQI